MSLKPSTGTVLSICTNLNEGEKKTKNIKVNDTNDVIVEPAGCIDLVLVLPCLV